MKFQSVRKIAGKALPYAALAIVVLFFVFGGHVLDFLQIVQSGLEGRLGRKLTSEHGVMFLADFDGVVPSDAISGTALSFWDVDRVDGKFGSARKIDLGRRSVIQFPLHLSSCSSTNLTFSAWFRPSDVNRKQVLFTESVGHSILKLSIFQENLLFSIADSKTNRIETCRYKGNPGSFAHIALVFGETDVSLWQNGNMTASIPFGYHGDFIFRQYPYGVEVHDPFEGEIDEIAVLNYALGEKEIRSLANSDFGIKRMYEPWLSLVASLTGGLRQFCSGMFRAVGRLAPSFDQPLQIDKNIPKLTLWPSKDDRRHFLAAHEKSLHSGYRTRKAAAFRKVDVSFGGKTGRCGVALDDVYGRGDGKRMSFIVTDPSRTVIGGCGAVRLYPPELHTVLHPDAPYPLPVSGTFVRFFLDDDFKGLYLVEPFDRVGSAWMARGKRDIHFHKALYYDSLPSLCDRAEAGVDPEEAYEKAADLVKSDVLFPWGGNELYARKKAQERKIKQEAFDHKPEFDDVLFHITANNPSPMYVTNNLAFDIPGLTWESSDTALVSRDGRVFRPESGAPRLVLLTPVSSDGVRGQPRRIRVVPLKPDLPAIFIHIGFPVEKHRHSDFVSYRIPAGGGEGEWLFGMCGNGGGIKHRGNTSYQKGAKRSFSVEFDRKIPSLGSSRTARHFLLYCGYADPTRLRNKVSFDSYRIAADEGVTNGIIDISWTEVFINGEYFGLWETSHRVKDLCEPKTLLYKVRASKDNIWRTTSTDMVDCESDFDPRSDPYDDLAKLFLFTANSSHETFAAQIDSRFYVDSLLGMYMVLNFIENFDGQFTNQYIARREEDVRWFIIPWDCDKTFFDTERSALGNYLFNRLSSDLPGFEDRLAAKWKKLREGEMSDEAVLGRIESDAAMLAPYMEEEYRLLQPLGWDGDFASAVDELKKTVAGRLKLMDRRFHLKSRDHNE